MIIYDVKGYFLFGNVNDHYMRFELYGLHFDKMHRIAKNIVSYEFVFGGYFDSRLFNGGKMFHKPAIYFTFYCCT